MNNYIGMFVIVATCIMVLLIGAVKKKMEWLLNMVMRSILGTVAIYFINMGFAAVGITSGVGINAVTVLTSGVLGFPGLLALYGIGFYQSL